MQTIFRLPWSTEPSSDEALADKMYMHKHHSHGHRPKQPRVEIPLLNALNNTKRKRTDSVDASPKAATAHAKKLKATADRDGAVQPAPLPGKGADTPVVSSEFRPYIPVAAHSQPSTPSPLATETKPPKNAVAHGGNAFSFQFAVEKGEPSTPGVTPASTRPGSLAPSPAPTPVDGTVVACGFDAFAVSEEKVAVGDPESNVDKLRAIIEAHINLEILHKHNELRLIEQELAKCQVSLEQLRRCELMPYPGTAGPSSAVTQGTGKSLKAPAGYTSPQHPAPWGVTDGPYARHYATWLLPDPAFDPWRSHPSHTGTPMTTRGSNRTMRTGFDFHIPAPAARTSRTSTGNRDPGTPTGAGSGRDPMVMKRQADGEWVRLRCSVCHRSNFNNIQGFLNHCRIAHHQDYKSHEAAAVACGEIVQVDEATMTATDSAPTSAVPKDTPVRATPTPLPTPSLPMPIPMSLARVDSLTTPVVEQPHVHPLITQGAANRKPVLEQIVDLKSTESPKPSPARATQKNGFMKGSLTPHLSALMQRRGLGSEVGDMGEFVKEAKRKVDLSVYDAMEEDGDESQGAAAAVDIRVKKGSSSAHHNKQKKPKSTSNRSAHAPASAVAKKPAPLTTTATRPASAKGAGRQAPTFAIVQHHPHAHHHALSQPPPITGVGFHPSVFQHVPETPDEDPDVEMELSPGTAPGLVSDHDDGDEFDDDVDEAGSANGSSGGFGMMGVEEVEIRDASDGESGGRRRSGEGVCEGRCGE